MLRGVPSRLEDGGVFRPTRLRAEPVELTGASRGSSVTDAMSRGLRFTDTRQQRAADLAVTRASVRI